MNPFHPIWQTVHWVAVIGMVGFVLWLNASNFDHTELQSIIQIGIGLAGLFGAQSWMARRHQAKGE